MVKNSQRLPHINLLQAIGVLLVIFRHTLSPYVNVEWWGVQYNNITSIAIIHHWIDTFHMPLFFFISGYLLAYKKYYEKSWLEYIKNRFKRLIIPFYAFAIIVWLPFCFWYLGKDLDVIIDFFSFEYCAHLWFLPALFISLMVYNALLKSPLKKNPIALTLIVLLIHFCHPHLSLPWTIYLKPLTSLIYIHLGYLYKIYFEKAQLGKDTFCKMWGVFAVIFIISALAQDFVLPIKFVLYPIYVITGLYVIIRSLTYMLPILADNTFVKYISANMMAFYLWHYPLLIIARRELPIMSPTVSIYILFPIILISITLLIESHKKLIQMRNK